MYRDLMSLWRRAEEPSDSGNWATWVTDAGSWPPETVVFQAGANSEEFRATTDVYTGPPQANGVVRYRGCACRLPQVRACKLHIVTRLGPFSGCTCKGKGYTLDIASLSEGTSLQRRSGMAHVVEGFHSFTCTFNHEWNEPYLSLPSQPKLVFIYRPQRDGRLSSPRRHYGESAEDC